MSVLWRSDACVSQQVPNDAQFIIWLGEKEKKSAPLWIQSEGWLTNRVSSVSSTWNHKLKAPPYFTYQLDHRNQLQWLHGPAASRTDRLSHSSFKPLNKPHKFSKRKRGRATLINVKGGRSHTICSIYEAAVLCVRRVWGIKSLNSELPPWTLCWIIHLFVEDVFDWGAEPEQTTNSSRQLGAA